MASRFLFPRPAQLSRTLQTVRTPQRSFSSSKASFQEINVTPVRRPVGAFRGGMFGFLFGVVLASSTAYYYVIDEYKISNDMLTEDIYALQATVQRIHDHVTELENRALQDNSRQ